MTPKSYINLVAPFVFLFCSQSLTAQCPTNFTVSSQMDADSFPSNYPGCEQLPGDLWIWEGAMDLSGLSQLKSVGGFININGGPNLQSLDGLNNITSVGTDILISSQSLQDLSGLSTLQTVGRDLWIKAGSLQSMSGLENLTSVGRDLRIEDNAMESLQGLAGLAHVERNVIIHSGGMTSIEGAGQLATVGELFWITFGPMLTSAVGFEGLTEVGEILFNTSFDEPNTIMETIDGFSSLASIGGNFEAFSLGGIKTFSGFQSLTFIGGQLFFPGTSPDLNLVDAFKSLQSVDWINMASGKIIDFTALQTVEQHVQLPSSLTELRGLNNLTSVGGSFSLTATDITSPPDFSSLISIGGDFNVTENESLTDWTGMNRLETVGGWFKMSLHKAGLSNITGFNQLREIGDLFEVTGNDNLLSVEGLKSLESVGGNFRLSHNAELIDCEAICNFLANGQVGGGINLFFNGPEGSPCRTLDDLTAACQSTFKEMRMSSANPELFNNWLSDVDDVRNVNPDDIVGADFPREGVAADGVTEVILISEFIEFGVVNYSFEDMPLERPWGPNTVEVDGRYYGFAIFKAPDVFPGTIESEKDEHGIAMEEVQINIVHIGKEVSEETVLIKVVRPPVVLVHGTYSNPEKAWKTASEGGQTMFQVLEDAGFKVFAVDYTASNGNSSSGPSSFEDNTMVLWANPGGIQEALDHYRNDLKIAATRADIVGHSLGGVLARVYASEHYHPEYKRAGNFMKGDINRLITLASTHFGSHLGELQIELADASPFEIGPLDWIFTFAQHLILSYYSGAAASEAVRDQRPAPYGGEALDLIGPTLIPSHAITASVPPFGLKDPVHDPKDEYYDLYWYTELMLYYNTAIRKLYLQKKLDLVAMGFIEETTWDGTASDYLARGVSDAILFSSMIDDAITSAGKLLAVLDGDFSPPSGAQVFHYAFNELGMSDIVDIDPFIFLFEAWTNPVGVVSGYVLDQIMPTEAEIRETLESTHEKSIEGVRSLIFNNDANDGVVSVTSQRGNIDDGPNGSNYTSHFEGVLHGFAPRYPEVQDNVIELLDGGMQHFNEDGFPDPSDVLSLYYPPNELDLYDPLIRGDDAICQSGMVPGHARAYARVADSENTIIIVRPVNPDATDVIANGAATKPMDVKPKSSNWGPQKGYLPSDQRYSKIWKLFTGAARTEQISNYNAKVDGNLADGITTEKQLQVGACENPYWVYIDKNKRGGAEDDCAEDEVVLVRVQDPSQVCYWGENLCTDGATEFSSDAIIRPEDCEALGPQHDLIPFNVMATPPEDQNDPLSTRLMTADYDLLMIGFHQENLEYVVPGEVPFRDGVGQLTPRQETLIGKLNAQANHPGGNLTHHGPENQFNHSPYVDYPLTVFAPDDKAGASGGEIISIQMGGKGFRDINLKNYVNKMRAEGYDLYDNPTAKGWKWSWNESLEGFELEDHEQLTDYVQQMPKRTDCNKVGNSGTRICDPTPTPTASNVEQESWLFPTGQPLVISPNPVSTDRLNVSVKRADEGLVTLVIADAYGNVRVTETYQVPPGVSEKSLHIGSLEPGLYTITLVPGGASVRFVRM